MMRRIAAALGVLALLLIAGWKVRPDPGIPPLAPDPKDEAVQESPEPRPSEALTATMTETPPAPVASPEAVSPTPRQPLRCLSGSDEFGALFQELRRVERRNSIGRELNDRRRSLKGVYSGLEAAAAGLALALDVRVTVDWESLHAAGLHASAMFDLDEVLIDEALDVFCESFGVKWRGEGGGRVVIFLPPLR